MMRNLNIGSRKSVIKKKIPTRTEAHSIATEIKASVDKLHFFEINILHNTSRWPSMALALSYLPVIHLLEIIKFLIGGKRYERRKVIVSRRSRSSPGIPAEQYDKRPIGNYKTLMYTTYWKPLAEKNSHPLERLPATGEGGRVCRTVTAGQLVYRRVAILSQSIQLPGRKINYLYLSEK